MYIVYTSPVDGLPRARKIQDYREAGLVLASLESLGVDAEVETDIDMAKHTNLPLLVSPWIQSHVIQAMRDHEQAEIII